MKQVIQNLRTGGLTLAEVPRPALSAGRVLVANAFSLISPGTERATVRLARQSLLGMARSRPDLVRRVVEKAREEGLPAALRRALRRLDQPMLLGYSSAGTILECAPDVRDLQPGMTVACAGTGYACHAEIVAVPRNLCIPLPEGAAPADTCFAALGAIALHGLRLSEATLGDEVAIIGLGLVGQLLVQVAKAAGCRVLAYDPLPERAALAETLGADLALSDAAAFLRAAQALPHGHGCDAVLIAAATGSHAPVELAAASARDRACVVAIGDVGMDLPRRAFYEKELRFLVSRSYGPGRYDHAYEEQGFAYPEGHVHWTETRNMAGFLDLVAQRRV